MYTIGTAGHVDHGKSTLVRALTGIDPDRLAEEKARQMTIDLGFAWLTLPDGSTLGLVDVPGHRDFIENMLAGVGGIDAALLVVAADEGIMPQTREHLAILDLLGIGRGLVALTKIDLVADPTWLELVDEEIRAALAPTALAQAEIIPLSALTGAGLPRLRDRLAALVSDLPPRPDFGVPRLPIDRIFTVSGFGTVVTGTLSGGALRVGDEVELQPSGLRGRVRGLHSYNQPLALAQVGSRVAVNLAGIERQAVARGHVLTTPGGLLATTLVDAQYRHLADRPLAHNAEVRVFSGTSAASARVRLLSDETLTANQTGWVQLRLDRPLALARGDRFILRVPSPAETIGGGLIVDPQPARRWPRRQPAVIAALELRLRGTPAERLAQAAMQPISRAALQTAVALPDFAAVLAEAVASRTLIALPDGTYLAAASAQAAIRRLAAELAAYHQANPLRLGMAREELRRRAGLNAVTFAALLAIQEQIVAAGPLLRLADHAIRFDTAQQARIDALDAELAAVPYTPPAARDAAQRVGEDVLRALIDLGEIVQVQPDVIFARATYAEMVAAVLAIIDADGSVTAAALRDRFGTSRKYAIALLEHLDALGVTRRAGDQRVRGAAIGRIDDGI